MVLVSIANFPDHDNCTFQLHLGLKLCIMIGMFTLSDSWLQGFSNQSNQSLPIFRIIWEFDGVRHSKMAMGPDCDGSH